MRIALICEYFPPAEGGVATSARRIALGLAAIGMNVQVLTLDSSDPASDRAYRKAESDEGVKVTRFGPLFPAQFDLTREVISERQRGVMRRRAFDSMAEFLHGKVDMIYSMRLLEAGYLAQLVAHELDVPCVAGARGNDIGLSVFRSDTFATTGWVLAKAAAITCVNEHLRRRLAIGFPEFATKTRVIHNAVHAPDRALSDRGDQRSEFLARAGWDEQHLVVVFIGQLREKKGLATLLEAFNILGSDTRIRLLVIGAEPNSVERQRCGMIWEDLIHKRRIFVTGMVSRVDVFRLARFGSIVIMPSVDDGMANGLLEGMAIGLCPVASDIFSDVVDNEQNGLLFPRSSASHLATLLKRLEDDHRLVQRLGIAAQLKAQIKFSPSAEIANYADLFEKVHAAHLQRL